MIPAQSLTGEEFCAAGAYGRRISVRFYSSGMTLDNINWATVDRIIRVDHAGEYGANRIYAGQMAVLGRTSVGPVIQKMWDQEKDHLKKFNELMVTFRVRPTVLMPFWNVVGFALGMCLSRRAYRSLGIWHN
uniref:Coenzyme Q7, hydroxylase n=1 Tax=Ursus americanus TaxID=9643 RepID=A0A452SFP3_URSAM